MTARTRLRLPELALAASLVGSLVGSLGVLTPAEAGTLLATLEGKAIFLMNGAHRQVHVGEDTGEFRLVAITDTGVIVESGGRRQRIGLGEGYVAVVGGDTDTSAGRLVLTPDEQGHYFANIGINGRTQRGLIDTGATHLSVSRDSARSMKIDYARGQRGLTQTAAGVMNVWLVNLPSVKVGTVTVYDVDVVVRDTPGASPLLIGTSLLNRFRMSRDQGMMVLEKKPL